MQVPTSSGDRLGLVPRWNNGLELKSRDGAFRFHAGGRIQADTTWYSSSGRVEEPLDEGGVGPLMDAWNFRRGRLRIDGTMYGQIEFAGEFDFVNEVDVQPTRSLRPPQNSPAAIVAPTDAWIAITETPLGNFRIGNQKDPFGFEHLVSSRYLSFLERSFNQDVFYGPFSNGFIPGVCWYDTALGDRMTWAVGEYKNVNNIFANGVGDGEYMTVGRVTMLPVYADEGRYLIHLGAAGRYMRLDEEEVRFRSRGNLRSGAPGPLNPVFADTGSLFGDDEFQLGLELVGVLGPWTLQSEWTGAWVQEAFTLANPVSAGLQPPPGTPLGTYFSDGCYVEVLYFLTGEHRAYDVKKGFFDRVVPRRNFTWQRGSCQRGPGAWQAGIRLSYLDLNDSGLEGGRLASITAGLNWFLNPNMKLQANYDATRRHFSNLNGAAGDGQVHGFGVRCAFDF